ncbi:MAG: RNA polymerase factor sigma-54 [Acidobacteriaceae bacterium]
MVLLQPKLSLKVSQRQVLTPSLVQMVSVLALNKLELKEMINAEIVENPMLEELEESVPLLDEIAGREAERDRSAEEVVAEATQEQQQDGVSKDPFDEIDFGSYFQDYLDPGYRVSSNYEELDAPSFENFLSQPSTLTDHLLWQLGSLNLSASVRAFAEIIIGNLNEDGYLTSSEEEILQAYVAETPSHNDPVAALALAQALSVVQHLDPLGVGASHLRECLLIQIRAQRKEAELVLARRVHQQTVAHQNASEEVSSEEMQPALQEVDSSKVLHSGPGNSEKGNIFDTAELIVEKHLALLQKKDMRELAKQAACTVEAAQRAVEFIRTLDPRPGQRYNQSETRLIEPDVAFVKRGDEYVVVMNEEDLPSLRLNQGYRKLLRKENAEKDVRDYVKERYKSAIQLMRNIEQRKNTILRTCEAIVRRQQEFLEYGIESLKPMMIKEVAEEIGVHPSTVSRAVANKYVHTTQGVFELRFFFSEGVNGPEGSGTSLMLLKRRVKKLIEEEDPRKPLTDEQLTSLLQQQGIEVTRRTVAKYREDLHIPSTHQRRVRD